MRKLNLFVLLIFCSTTALQAQEFDLNAYKFRYQKFRSLSSVFSFNNGGSMGSSLEVDTNFNVNNSGNFGNNGAKLIVAPNFNSYENSERLQQTTNIRFNNNLTFTTNRSAETNVDYAHYGITNIFQTNILRTSRYYNGSKFKLLAFGAGTSLENMKSESNHASPIPDQTNSLNGISAYGNFEVGFGRGRLEYVTDAVAANFLLQDLRSKLGIEYNARDIEQLANNITKIRNQRYFDFRFGRIKQLELLNEALTGLGIENVGIEYFNTINDNWLSATRLNRFSGSRWTYSLAGRLWGTNTKSENVQQFQTNMFTSYQMNGTQVYYIGPAIEYQKYHQTSQNTQIAWGGKLSSGINFRENKFLSFKDSMALPSDMGSPSVSLSDDWLNQLQLNCSYLFQPNSRTFLTINVSPNIAWRESWQELRFTGIPESRTAIQSNVATSLNYFRFINQRLTYTIGLNVNAMNSRNFNRTFRGLIESSQSTILYGIDAGVTYQLF